MTIKLTPPPRRRGCGRGHGCGVSSRRRWARTQPFSLLLKVGVAKAFFAAIALRARREPGSGRPRLAVADDVDDGWVPPSPNASAQHLDAVDGIVPARCARGERRRTAGSERAQSQLGDAYATLWAERLTAPEGKKGHVVKRAVPVRKTVDHALIASIARGCTATRNDIDHPIESRPAMCNNMRMRMLHVTC